MLTRATSVLPENVERVAEAVIGAAIAVHRELGPGFLERIYEDALCIELTTRTIRFEREKPIGVLYRGVLIPGQRVDLVVEDLVVVELKAITKVDPIHEAIVLSYLKTMKLRLGLLINFHARLLKEGLQRIAL